MAFAQPHLLEGAVEGWGEVVEEEEEVVEQEEVAGEVEEEVVVDKGVMATTSPRGP